MNNNFPVLVLAYAQPCRDETSDSPSSLRAAEDVCKRRTAEGEARESTQSVNLSDGPTDSRGGENFFKKRVCTREGRQHGG